MRALQPVHGAEECALLKLLFMGAYNSLVFHALLYYLTTNIIWAIRFADNAVTELWTTVSIKNTQTSTLTAGGSIQAGWTGKAASPAWKRSWSDHTSTFAWTPGFRKKHLDANISLVHWFMKTRGLMPGVLSVRSWSQTITENQLLLCICIFQKLLQWVTWLHSSLSLWSN